MHKPWLICYDPGVPPGLAYADCSLDTILAQAARKYPEQIATRFILRSLAGGRLTIGGRLTYRTLNELVDRFATALYQLGIRKGDRVGLMLPNSPQFVIAFFAALRVGAVVVAINPTYTSHELQPQLADSETETLIILNLFWPRLREIQPQTALKRVIVTSIFDTLAAPARQLVALSQRRARDWVEIPTEHDIFFFEQLLRQYDPVPPHIAIRGDDTALLQYTGGTTGQPKAAMLTHRNMLANVTQIMAWVTGVQHGREKMMAAIPFFHVYGLSACMLYGIYLGGELVIVPNPRPIENVMQIIEHQRCTLFPGVPVMYINMVNHPRVRSYNLKSVKVCISGSAPLPLEIQKRFAGMTGGQLVEGYGLTEASPVTHCTPLNGAHRSGSMGIPLPDVEARLVDAETGADIPFDGEQTGELLVRGPQVMRGYWKRPAETALVLDADGWLHTGDICRADADGYFYLVDRKKDSINVGGYKVLPREVEDVLLLHPGIREAVVAGIPHPERGDDVVKAFVVPQPGTGPTPEELQSFCRNYLAPYKIPREIEFRSELPRTAVGKVLRRLLIEEEMRRK